MEINKNQLVKEWKKGWEDGVKSVFTFLRDMGKINQSSKMEEEYLAWENADEYTKLYGEVVKRYE